MLKFDRKIYVIPVLSFLAMIVITAFLLKLSICNQNHIRVIDAFYQSASMITATGSTTVNLSEQFTFLGQLILLMAMQIGAIGFMLLFSLLFMFSKRKLKLSDSMFLGNEINTTNYHSVKSKAKQITRYTLVIEFFGAWLLSFRFIPLYGITKGIWYSIFHCVSAFCNVGADILGSNSLVIFHDDLYVNIILMVVMFFGSLGFFVLEDIGKKFFVGIKTKWHTQTRLIFDISVVIIIVGTILIKIFDPQLTFLEALFETVTARNTGFFTVDMQTLSQMNKVLVSIIMFIGGGPGSNAGGIRVVVFVILLVTAIANIKQTDQVVIYYHNINDKLIKKAVSIFVIDLGIVFLGMLGLYVTETQAALDIIFYVVSIFSNTGLVSFPMETISFAGKCISIMIMYMGRIAPITFVSLFTPIEHKKTGIKYPDIDLML